MWSLWQSCCQATQNIFQTVLCCNPLGNVTEKKTKQNTRAHCRRWSARWRRCDTRGCSIATCSYSQLCILHWCTAALCWHTVLFFPRGIMGFCALLHLFWWLTVHHGWGREGTVNCALFQQIIVPSVDDANTAFDQRAHFQCLSFIHFLLLLLLLRVSRAQWTSWSRRRTWLSWWGAAAGESSLLALSRSVQVSRGDRNVSSVQPNLWKIEVDLTNQLLLKPPRWQAASF